MPRTNTNTRASRSARSAARDGSNPARDGHIPLTARHLESLARSLVERGLCSPMILEHTTGAHTSAHTHGESAPDLRFYPRPLTPGQEAFRGVVVN